jgi:C-terminal processing protease CtpA/Prc
VRVDTLRTDKAVELLRGRPGTDVSVEMLRPGVEEPIEFSIERAVIRLRAVPFAVMLEDGVGYLPLLTVRETSSREMLAAIDSLRGQGLRALVLDLRGNPGGLLDEGIAVTDLFLQEDQVIVETRGRGEGAERHLPSAVAGTVTPAFPSSSSSTPRARRHRRSSPVHCRTTTVPSSWERRLSARARCRASFA